MQDEFLRIGGFDVRDTNTAAMTRFLRRRIQHGHKVAVGFVNHHFVTACQSLSCGQHSGRAHILVNDGIGMQLAAMLRFGRGFGENMNGTDFVPHFLGEAHAPYRVFFIGGQSRVVQKAAEAISDMPHCQVVGYCDGFSLWQHEESVLREISGLKPDVLLVGLGNPLQERWIVEHWPRLEAKVIFGVGALFDWMTGLRRRAPRLVRLVRLEWAYRLAIEPRRLLRRYTIDVLTFLSLVLRDDLETAADRAVP